MDFAAQTALTRPTLIALSHLRWDFVFQRPQHLLTRAAETYDVIVVEEPIFGDYAEPDVNIGNRGKNIRIVQPLLPHGTSNAAAVDHQRILLDDLMSDAAGQLTLWYYTPMALPFSRHIEADLTVFDKMDELAAFANAPPLLLALEQEMLERADVVFTGGASMHEASVHRHDNIHCFPSSIDTDHFRGARAHDLTDPSDQATIPYPRIGFFGVIDERMDVALVGQVARLRPDWQLVMIGPTAKINPADLPRSANIHWLGGKTYNELPAYLGGWDIGFMPFALNDATKFISPTKTPEFLAAGLPVVSTAIRDVIRPYGELGLVDIASNAGETVSAIERLMVRDTAPWLAQVDVQLAKGSWDQVWSDMQSAMKDALNSSPAPQPNKETTRV